MTRPIRSLRLLAGLPLALALSGVAATALPAAAQTGCEAKVMASGVSHGILADAVTAAPAGTTIQVRGSCLGPIVIDKNLTLVGKPSSTLGGPGIYGQESVRVLEIAAGRTVTVKSLEIAFGWAGTVSPTGAEDTTSEGGGILNWGTLTLTDVVVDENTAGDGGGIANYGILRIDGASQVHHNRAAGYGGGILSEGRVTIAGTAAIHSNTADEWGGGIAAVRGSLPKPGLTIRDSAVIRGNTAERAGGILFSRIPVLLRDRAAVRANTASQSGGGVYVVSGGRFTMEGRATISGNAASETGGILVDIGAAKTTTVTLKGSSVIKGNTGEVGAIFLQAGALTMLDDSSIRGHRTLPSSATVAIGTTIDEPVSFTMKGRSRVTENRVNAGLGAVLKITCPEGPTPTFIGVKARTIGNTPKNIVTGCP